MAKNIILCSDGTGNSAVKGRGTNVFKLFEAVDLNGHKANPRLDPQLAYYDDGVGTEGNTIARVLGGAVGFGLGRNVRQLYRELSRVYDPGDRIFLFGFSRGAFTVRTLAGLIGTLGVVNAEDEAIGSTRALDRAIEQAYRAYRTKYCSRLSRGLRSIVRGKTMKEAVAECQRTWPVRYPVEIEFIGVWDTVDAVGMPFALASTINEWIVQYKFSTQTLGPYVKRACHALALDDERRAFEPVLWQAEPEDTRIEQVWFAGAHSNVGGGYPKQGMSLVALDWMLTRAQDSGLRLQRLDVELFRNHASADDMLYDSRAGLGVFYRWAPRDVTAYCEKSGVAPVIHLSVAERIAHGTSDYAPGNIPANATIAFTPPESVVEREVLQQRAAAVGRVIRKAHKDQGDRHLLATVNGAVKTGALSYWLFVLIWPTLLIGAGAALSGAVPWYAPLVAVGALAAGASILSRRADSVMSDAFSHFWHQHRPELRSELKRVNREARARVGDLPDVQPS